jgi:cytochrome c oxidase assembly protein subunit 15
MLHRFATFVAGCTVLLVLAGSLVTSTGSGLAVPDWPTTYGWNMLTFPPSKWVGGIFYEHGHRLIATTVGFLTIILAVWLWLADPRRWIKRLGVIALSTVILQGLLGGITVLFFLPAPISTAHAGLAEVFFCLTVALALFTSRDWMAGATHPDDETLRRRASATTALIYVQILLGAAMRHTGAGLAIPDFPLMFGGVIPDHWNAAIAVHFAHRVGALLVTIGIIATSARIWSRHRQYATLVRPAILALALVTVQITLGAMTVLSGRDVWINSAHVLCGALVLATSLVITLRSWRVRFADTVRLEPDGTYQTGGLSTRAPMSERAQTGSRA